MKVLKPVTLQDRGQQVKIPVPVGGSLKASRFHPTAPDYLVVSQTNSDKFGYYADRTFHFCRGYQV